MASDNLLDTVQQHLGPDAIRQLSDAIGADPATTGNAVSMALPALIGGLSRNAAQPQGAAALDQALGAHDGSILGNLGGILGGGGGGGMGGIGGAILGHIFGNKRGDVEQGVGRASGLNASQISQLLMMLAPIVMGALGRMKRERGIDASNLPSVLGGGGPSSTAAASPGGLDLNSILDSNRDGSVGDDVARLGESVLGGLFRGK